MVFVDKTLDDMLKEIGFSKPIELNEFNPWTCKLKPKKSYLLKTEQDCKFNPKSDLNRIAGELDEEIINHLAGFYDTGKLTMRDATWFSSMPELIVNAIEWGGGIKEINYYSAPGGVIVELIQYKNWDYKSVLEKVRDGLYPSRRKKTKAAEKSQDKGGRGLGVEGKKEYSEICYQGKSTIVLLPHERIKKVILKAYKK